MRKVLGLADVVNAPDLITGRDIVLVEATLGKKVGDAASKATYGAAKEMKARVIAVEAYSGQAVRNTSTFTKGSARASWAWLLNKVPPSQLKSVKEEAAAQFGAAGIKVLGVIPENRVLLAITVGELAENIQGKDFK